MFTIIDVKSKQYFWKIVAGNSLITLEPKKATIFYSFQEAKDTFRKIPSDGLFDFKIVELIPKL